LEGLVNVFAGILGFFWSAFVIVVCWVAVRPYFILGLIIIVAVGVGLGVWWKLRKRDSTGDEEEMGEMNGPKDD